MTTAFVYKLLTHDDWTRAEQNGATSAAIDLADGYVHLSTSSQVGETARLYFGNSENVRLLEFAVSNLPPLKWEASRGGQSFPHLYAPLEIAKASRKWTLKNDASGAPIMPKDL